MALSPSGFWKLNEAFNAASYADSSGAALTATVTGAPVSNCHSLICNVPTQASVWFGGVGRATLASNATFDYSSPTAFSIVVTILGNPGSTFTTICGKINGAGNSGYEFFCNADGTYHLRLNGGGNTRIYAFTIASAQNKVAGIFHISITMTSTWSTSPIIKVNGVSMTVTASGTTPSAGISNAGTFSIGARFDGTAPYAGSVQYLAFWSGVTLSSGQTDALWTAHNTPTNRLNAIFDSDCGVGDRGDIIDFAYWCLLHQAKLINLLGVISSSNVNLQPAPSTKAMLMQQHAFFPTAGFDQILVGSYQGLDSSSDAGGPCTLVCTAAGAPYSTQTGADYISPETFYDSCLSGKAANSVLVYVDGTAHAVQKYCNASAGNLATFNSVVKQFTWSAGQYFNSSDAASPAGNFAAAGVGEHNISNTASSITNAQYLVANITVPFYWSGVEMCGGTGNSPALGTFITSGTPGGWPATNLIRVGDSNLSRTAWDQHGGEAAFAQCTVGSGGGWLQVTDISAPTINANGQNASAAGSSNHHFFAEKLGGVTQANWRTRRGSYLNCLFPILGA